MTKSSSSNPLRAVLAATFIAACLLYFILSRPERAGIEEFLAETSSLIDEGMIDPDLIFRLASSADVQIDVDMNDAYARYFEQAASELGALHGISGFTIAVNEAYGPIADLHIYILGLKAEDWLAKMRLSCNALADTRRRVIVIDLRVLTALATGQACTEELLSMGAWMDDPTSILNFTVRSTGIGSEEEFSQNPALILEHVDISTIRTDYWARQLVPLLVIGHEIGHLALHSDAEMEEIDHGASSFNETEFFDLEFEADRFAIDLLVRSMASTPSSSVEEMLAEPTIQHRLLLVLAPEISRKAHRFAASTFVENPEDLGSDRMLFFLDEGAPTAEGARSAELAYVDSLIDAEWECSKNIGLAHRMLDMAARMQYYLWILQSSNSDLLTASAQVGYDDYYESVRGKLEEAIGRCNAFINIWR